MWRRYIPRQVRWRFEKSNPKAGAANQSRFPKIDHLQLGKTQYNCPLFEGWRGLFGMALTISGWCGYGRCRRRGRHHNVLG